MRAGWTRGGNPRPYVTAPGLDEATTGTLIAQHARSAHAEGSWLQRDITLNGTPRALMSPRLNPFGDEKTWRQAQRSRHEILDALTTSSRWLDLRLLASLGEPCYWWRNRQGAILQDDGASRLEMQPRNQGSEFVGNRLANSRAPSQVATPGRSSPGCAATASATKSAAASQTAAPRPGWPAPGPPTTPSPGAPSGESPSSRSRCESTPKP